MSGGFEVMDGVLRQQTPQVRHHLLTLFALPHAHLTHSGLWMQWRPLTLLFGCVAADAHWMVRLNC